MIEVEIEHPGDPLDILAEECAEVIQSIMKLRRFGDRRGNRDRFVQEMGDLAFAIDLALGSGAIAGSELRKAKAAKKKRFAALFPHSALARAT